MKTSTLWIAPNTGATNESGFSGLPGGFRYYANGNFNGLGIYGYWWSSSEIGPDTAWGRYLNNSVTGISRNNYYFKRNGFCVRCVRD